LLLLLPLFFAKQTHLLLFSFFMFLFPSLSFPLLLSPAFFLYFLFFIFLSLPSFLLFYVVPALSILFSFSYPFFIYSPLRSFLFLPFYFAFVFIYLSLKTKPDDDLFNPKSYLLRLIIFRS